jgi:hypothetical protein
VAAEGARSLRPAAVDSRPVLAALGRAFHTLLEADHNLPAADHSHFAARIRSDLEKTGHSRLVAGPAHRTVDHTPC